MPDHLSGKVIVITGAGGGLGAAYARDAADRGAWVIVADVDEPAASAVVEDIQSVGGVAVAQPCDVSRWDECEALIERCRTEFGRIDGLVNNAGIARQGAAWELDEASIRPVIEVNLMGAVFCGTLALRHMVAQGSGAVLNIVSNSQAGGVGGISSYAATKGGAMSLTYTWALELEQAGHDVRVNALSPWALGTRIQRDFRNPIGEVPAEQAAHLNAPLVSFLLSDAAHNVRGRVIRLNPPELSYTAKPVPVAPMLTSDNWTFESIRDAFAGPLG